MWLLNSRRAELHYFVSPSHVRGGYAILSHTWNQDGTEQTFQDIRALGERCKADGTNPRDRVSFKIRGCCILAEHHGYDWAWVDSCCIDKTNPTELSEAINSMFMWYTQAEVCYVYLVDVSGGNFGALKASDSAFRKSRWHGRGWTLQELIAPAVIIFFAQDWSCLGRREEPAMARLLEDITGIPQTLLQRSAQFFEWSVAQRMSWASGRKTTRIEDEAYCLLGIFNVKMPTIYGEGTNAFQRLQLEIMKASDDASLFAWDIRTSLGETPLEAQGLVESRELSINILNSDVYLLASSPHNFRRPVSFTPNMRDNALQRYPPTQVQNRFRRGAAGPFDHVELPRFTSTSYGIECRIPLIEANGYSIAVLLCETGGAHLGLLLFEDYSGVDPTRPRYFTSHVFRSTGSMMMHVRRTVTLGDDLYNLQFNGTVVKAKWRTIYIVPAPSDRASADSTFSRLRLRDSMDDAFRIPHWLVATFAAMFFQADQNNDEDPSNTSVYRVVFRQPVKGMFIFVDLGLCKERLPSVPTSGRKRSSQPQRPALWARVFPDSFADKNRWSFPARHDCLEHHIDAWPMQAKVFSNGESHVRISFDPCRVRPETTRDVHLELFGPAYEEVLHDANVKIPTYMELRQAKDAPDLEPLPPFSAGAVSVPPLSSFATPAERSLTDGGELASRRH